MYGTSSPKGWLKEAVNLNDKFYLIEMLQSGSLLKIFPMYNEVGKLQWYAPNMYIPAQADSMDNIFVPHFFPRLYETLMQGDMLTAGMYVDKLIEFQQRKAGNVLPSVTHLRAEQIFNRVRIFSLLFKVCLTLGSLCLLFFIFNLSRCNISVQRFFFIALLIAFVATTIGLGLRTYIGGRFPLRGTYETMLLLAWFSMLTGILMRRHSLLIVAFSFLLSGFTLLVAHIGAMSPYITPLVPVLKSPLLSIHVLTIMIAYGLCGFMALNSITALIVVIFGGKSDDSKAYINLKKETSELFMYPATFLMGAGIFIGAIWANMSWGRYWGWDPKEVWALITFLLMSFTFHSRTLAWFRKPIFYHIFVLLIFLSVLMTYFGVNYILGGIHSYAG
jgi:ABC-type transport system involved in cytochrome c biogenesis permease subunit